MWWRYNHIHSILATLLLKSECANDKLRVIFAKKVNCCYQTEGRLWRILPKKSHDFYFSPVTKALKGNRDSVMITQKYFKMFYVCYLSLRFSYWSTFLEKRGLTYLGLNGCSLLWCRVVRDKKISRIAQLWVSRRRHRRAPRYPQY